MVDTHVLQIPYTVTRLEVAQFFGRDSPLLPPFQCPVHIIMERTSGRTMVCYAEFNNEQCARAVVHRLNQVLDAEQRPRMGNRRVDVSLSSQDALLKELFPMVKCIDWVDGQPVERRKREDEWYSTGFSGLLTDEELFCLAKHARDPQRVCHSAHFLRMFGHETNAYPRAFLPARCPRVLMNPS